jgi:hypothetical protein
MTAQTSLTAQAAHSGRKTYFDTGSGDRTLNFYDSGNTLLATFTIAGWTEPTNACPSVMTVTNTLPITGTAEAFSGSPRTLNYATITNRAGTVVYTVTSGDIGTTGTPNKILTITSLSVEAEQPINITALSLTQPC